jgi:hypothetical protein
MIEMAADWSVRTLWMSSGSPLNMLDGNAPN